MSNEEKIVLSNLSAESEVLDSPTYLNKQVALNLLPEGLQWHLLARGYVATAKYAYTLIWAFCAATPAAQRCVVAKLILGYFYILLLLFNLFDKKKNISLAKSNRALVLLYLSIINYCNFDWSLLCQANGRYFHKQKRLYCAMAIYCRSISRLRSDSTHETPTRRWNYASKQQQ